MRVPFSRERAAPLLLAYCPSAVFALFIVARGLPALRHDWFTLSGRVDLLHFTLMNLAWQPNGIGAVRVYPTDYFFAFVGTALSLLFGTQIGMFLYALSIGALCIYGARALVALEKGDRWAAFGFGTFAIFNPWVYVKVVEGHLAMIAAYGALMALVAELCKSRPRWKLVALLLAPMAQLQFFILGMATCCLAALVRREREAIFPLVCGVCFAFPTLVGFAVDSSQVAAIPYNLDWQASQSIAPVDAAALTGFFARYTEGFPPVAFDAVWAIAALALIGVFARRRKRGLAFLAIAICAWAFSTGTKGPFETPYVFLVSHVPFIELYRELYDLLALVAIAYIGLGAIATSRFAPLGLFSIFPGLVLAACWLGAPPDRFWVHRSELPTIAIDAAPNTRFALYPDVSPLTFGNRGSGIDPDAYARPGNVTPLNGSDAAYPALVALQMFAQDGDTTDLRSLGVSRVYGRSWLRSDLGASSGVSAVDDVSRRGVTSEQRSLAPIPELSLLDSAAISQTLPRLGSGQIFYGDVAGIAGPDMPVSWKLFVKPISIPPPRGHLSAASDWVDVRGAFAAQPELGQALGGALTTSSTALFSVGDVSELLVDVRGSLLSPRGHVLTRSTRGYQWIALPMHFNALRCSGECVVAASGSPPDLLQPKKPHGTGLDFFAPLPWIAWTTLPARQDETVVKYLVGYDRAMIAFSPLGILPHVRIEAAFNGWFVSPHRARMGVLFVNLVSLSQFTIEFLDVGLVLVLIWNVATNRANRHHIS